MRPFEVLFCALIALIPSVLCNVPVLLWNTHETKNVNFGPVSALQQISVGSLQARYFDIFKPNNVLLFLQDTLSIEDLSSHASELKHVNKYMKDAAHKLYVPNVVEPAQLQHKFIKQGYKVTKLSAGSAISELKLNRNVKNLVLVKLPQTDTNPIRSRALRKADEVIQSVVSKIGDMAEFTVIYTGAESSLNPSSSNVASRTRIARSLKQIGKEESIPKNFHNNTNIAMYIRKNMTLSLPGSNGEFFPLPEENSQAEAQGHRGDAEQSIKITYLNVDIGDQNYYSIAVEINFSQKRGYYFSPSAQIQLQESGSKSPETKILTRVSFGNESIAIGRSFACNDILSYKEGTLLNATDVTQLRLNGIQVEAFMTDSSRFHDAWDCIGFFSIGVWAGLLVALLSIIILTMGLFVLSDIKTMDRFDDPKGKTIMIPQTSD